MKKRRWYLTVVCVFAVVTAISPTVSAADYYACGDAMFADDGVDHVYADPCNVPGYPDWEWDQGNQWYEMIWVPPAQTPWWLNFEACYVLANVLLPHHSDIDFILDFEMNIDRTWPNPQNMGSASDQVDTIAYAGMGNFWDGEIGPVICPGNQNQGQLPIYELTLTFTITDEGPNPDVEYEDEFIGMIYVS